MATLIDHRGGGRSVIVAGVDFSPLSLRAAEVAANMAARSPVSDLHLVHASPLPMSTRELRDLFAQWGTDYGGMITKAREELDRLTAKLDSGTGRVTGHIRIGGAAKSLVELASELGADLVVVGASERTGMTRALLGSVAEKVTREAPCPVLVVRDKTIPAWEQIEPPCPDCLRAREATHGDKLWCERHSQRHPRTHVHYETPFNYGLGSLTFRQI
jgi:nucleotide-binding universal stress UspA family protein